MASVVRGAMNLIKEKGIGGFFRELRNEGYLSALLDGNLIDFLAQHFEYFDSDILLKI